MRGRGRGGWRRISGDDDDEEEEEHKSSSGDEDSDESEEAIRLEMEENEQDEDEDENEEEEEEEIEYDEEENSENHTQQQHQEQEEEEEEEEEEEGEGEEEEEGENYEQPEPPKLDEGFFEIEDVRRKRVRKGQTLYFIKWRGWPETANTWEPIENLQACCDVVEAFEKSLRPGSRGRKRKRRGSFSQPKKTQQHMPSSNVSGSKRGRKPRSLTSPSIDSSKPLTRPLRHRVASKSVYGESKGNEKNEGGSNNEDGNNVDTTAQQTENENGSFNGYELREGTSTDNINSESRKVSIHFSHMRTSDMVEGHSVGLPKVDFDENTQSNRFTGAKRRKSGNVKRFKKEDAQNGLENGEGSTWEDQQKVGRLSNPCSITKIMKPIGYSASISNDVQDVCVTFVAMSSDGREVVVDNKQLKADNPQLLISFYEQHLRYSPPA